MYALLKITSIVGTFLLMVACQSSTQKTTKAMEDVYLPLPQQIITPKNNPITPEKVALGRLLFYDPILSGNKEVACATCHHPDYGYSDGIDLSIGVNGKGLGYTRKFNSNNNISFVKRNAHTILNTAYNGIDNNQHYSPSQAPMFWDNRMNSLENQVLGPLTTLEEMRGDRISETVILDTIIHRLQQIDAYQDLFKKAFPKELPHINKIHLAKAIATFERTLTTPNTRFDKYLQGDVNAISETEKEGFKLFKKAKCHTCHSGPMFSDYKIHILGVEDNDKLNYTDDGHQKSYGFRTPTLRNLRYTAPYMHNGSLQTLQQVLEFYEDIAHGNSRNKHVASKQLDTLTKGIPLKVKDMTTIISFFNTLNAEDFDKTIPEKVPSNLPVGGNIQ
ncbi:cytochrome-c peroxidase [Wenyingzhuangia fucanilytica]|uniref:Cytochrome-c peroxidase n=1 Tax=Wenyingzhuangia fucanilytica TaxID=1790137 RepID=A0A1B1Y544_9FLAO|nr:cytochrome c peroxidase [Wenyingzhuangia fucanilytica]ANW95892.1 cytochrome-c peroxidase [Wenyingzhuangia fucanilytica]